MEVDRDFRRGDRNPPRCITDLFRFTASDETQTKSYGCDCFCIQITVCYPLIVPEYYANQLLVLQLYPLSNSTLTRTSWMEAHPVLIWRRRYLGKKPG